MNQLNCAFIVDDDPIHQFGMKVLMEKLEFSKKVMVFYNGQEAIDALLDMLRAKKQFPNVIFLDLNMPIKDGWGFLDDFVQIPHSNREKVLIYVVSSSISPLDQEKAKEYAVVSNYLVKPIDESDLKNILNDFKW